MHACSIIFAVYFNPAEPGNTSLLVRAQVQVPRPGAAASSPHGALCVAGSLPHSNRVSMHSRLANCPTSKLGFLFVTFFGGSDRLIEPFLFAG